MIRAALAAILLAGAGGAVAQQPEAPPTAGPGEAFDYSKIPPRFSAVKPLVEALAMEEQAAFIVDSFWGPATALLVAANPDKAEAARRHARALRDREVAIYPRLIEMGLDKQAVELLNPDVAEKLKALEEREWAAKEGSGGFSDARQRAYTENRRRITAAAHLRANTDLARLVRLAHTPDGVALRKLQREGLVACEWQKARLAKFPEEQKRCTTLLASPAHKRLLKSEEGRRLIRISNAAQGNLMGLVAMAHGAGLSLHSLLPPEGLTAAGLNVPPDQSIEPVSQGQS